MSLKLGSDKLWKNLKCYLRGASEILAEKKGMGILHSSE